MIYFQTATHICLQVPYMEGTYDHVINEDASQHCQRSEVIFARVLRSLPQCGGATEAVHCTAPGEKPTEPHEYHMKALP